MTKIKQKLILIILLVLSFQLTAQERYTISGYVKDKATGEQLLGVNIYEEISGRGAVTNEYGFYSLSLPKGNRKLQITTVGYKPHKVEFLLEKDTIINVSLSNSMVELKEVLISTKQSQVDNPQMSMIDLSVPKLAKIPTIMGEPDVLKVIQLLPGVQSGAEGTSGIYVRGGDADQNLFLLDGVPVYNVSHLFGFFSVFNSGSIKSVKLYKGGFPARYGGRLSSVVDIRMKEGSQQKFKGDVSIGLISSRINLEGPIVKGKTAFLFSARRTYIDVLVNPFIAMSQRKKKDKISGGYYFYDLNAKVNHTFSDRSRLYLSTYLGTDKFYSKSKYEYTYSQPDGKPQTHKSKSDGALDWGNRIAALRWNYLLTNKLFSNTTITYSKYNFNTSFSNSEMNVTKNESSDFSANYFSSIEDVTAKVDFDYAPHPNHHIKFGGGFTSHLFKPGVSTSKMMQGGASKDSDRTHSYSTPKNDVTAYEHYAFLEDEISIGEDLKINAGLHYSGINVQNTFYPSLQPRFSAHYRVKDTWSLKASYAKMTQYVHLLSSSTIDMPTDLWVPVTARLKPPTSHQYALGTSIELPYDLDLTVEGFYKKMNHLIAYKEGASFRETAGTNWDEKVESGKGWSYGVEFLLEKTVGKTTGWLGYTLGKSERQFPTINFGKVFPARYDRRHDISVVVNHKFSERWDIGATWVYSTGNALTLGAYEYPVLNKTSKLIHVTPTDYGGRNSYRMPSYHRMDIGFNNHKKRKYGTRTWSFSIYNAYSRQNPFILIWEQENDKKLLKQISIFPIIPSISYSYKF